MANCCDSILNLGCANYCTDTVVSGQVAAKNGVYTFSLVPGGGFYQVTLAIGEAIDISASSFNEDKVTIFKILDPDDVEVLSGTNDCYRIDIKSGQNLSSVNT